MLRRAHDFGERRIGDRSEMHRYVAAARVLAEHGRAEIPARIIVKGEIAAIEAGPQRRRGERRTIITIGKEFGAQYAGGRHIRASGGK